MNVNWQNPYAEIKGPFTLKGSLHTHTINSSCGKIPLPEVVEIYEKMQYAFIAITDHNMQTDISSINSDSLTILPGIEIDINFANHFGIVNTDPGKIHYSKDASQQELIDRNISSGSIVTLNHPDWQSREHYSIDKLLELKNYTGIEIYNSVIEFLQGSPLSTAKWDRLLLEGRRVLGFANQDFHKYQHALDCCNVITGRDRRPEAIMRELLAGRFYCHYGVNIISLGRNGDTVYVETENAELIRFIGDGGVVLKKSSGKNAEIDFDRDAKINYIRIECLGKGEEISFSQPFFID